LKKLLFEMEDAVFDRVNLRKQDITLLNYNLPSSDNSLFKRFAMLDVAYYNHEDHLKKKGEIDKQGNEVVISVAAHYDPGILSLNVLNSEKGLQFLDENKNWVDIPVSPSVGVLWAGALAEKITKGKVKPGWHRVFCHKAAPVRMSIWIEACTSQQDLSMSIPSLEKITIGKASEADSVKFPSIRKYNKEFQADEDIPKFETITVYPGQSLSVILSNASRLFGVPMTKSMPMDYCPFCLELSEDLVEHAKKVHKDKVVFAPGVKEWEEEKQEGEGAYSSTLLLNLDH